MGNRAKVTYGEAQRLHNVERVQYKLALELLRFLPKDTGKKIMDVGAGMGEFADILSSRGFSVSCVEGEKYCLEVLRRKKYPSYQVDLESQNFPFPCESFDVVVSLEVIEHVWNTDHYLREIRRVLKPGGYAIFTTPNYNYLIYRIRAFMGRFEYFTYQSRHKKFYTSKSFPLELKDYFKIEQYAGRIIIPKVKVQFNYSYGMNLFALHIGALCQKLTKNHG